MRELSLVHWVIVERKISMTYATRFPLCEAPVYAWLFSSSQGKNNEDFTSIAAANKESELIYSGTSIQDTLGTDDSVPWKELGLGFVNN